MSVVVVPPPGGGVDLVPCTGVATVGFDLSVEPLVRTVDTVVVEVDVDVAAVVVVAVVAVVVAVVVDCVTEGVVRARKIRSEFLVVDALIVVDGFGL